MIGTCVSLSLSGKGSEVKGSEGKGYEGKGSEGKGSEGKGMIVIGGCVFVRSALIAGPEVSEARSLNVCGRLSWRAPKCPKHACRNPFCRQRHM